MHLRREPAASWDFSPVLDLISSLSATNDAGKPSNGPLTDKHPSKPDGVDQASTQSPSSLGDFARLWQFLGTPNTLPPPQVPQPAAQQQSEEQQKQQADASPPPAQQHQEDEKQKQQTNGLPAAIASPPGNEYTSDGAIYCPPSAIKGVKWRDEVNGCGLADAVPAEAAPATPLTKTQKRKERRKQAKLERGQKTGKSVSEPESESDLDAPRKAPARKASVHTLAAPAASTEGTEFKQTRYNLRPRSNPSTPVRQQAESQDKVAAVTEPPKTHAGNGFKMPTVVSPTPAVTISQSHQAVNVQLASHPLTLPRSIVPNPVPSPYDISFPLRPAHAAATATPNQLSHHTVGDSLLALQTTQRHRVKPLVERKGDDRYFALLLKLIHNFGEDRSWLVKPVQVANHTTAPDGIHVFVDFSNIFIGFNEFVKRARGIPAHAHVPRTNISFESLVLLMERRRPVAKRVLAGSAPFVPAFDTARAIGYELNILDKVLKAKELTDRQRFFQQQRRSRLSLTQLYSGHSSSGSDGVVPQLAPEKWVEQGVDEILHLKILESVVDVETPTTMVLATGDAAEAEYSQGFMRMVERALARGWRVELVSWSKNVSFAYRKDGFRSRWGDMFRLIELDGYAEDLLDI